jgi:hypothetical protein
VTTTRLWPQSHKAAQPAAAVALTDKSIAVLPFVDMSEKKDQEYFSDELSGELIDMLTKIPKLRVPARTSSFYFKGKQATIAESPKGSAWHTCWKEAFANRAIICASPPSADRLRLYPKAVANWITSEIRTASTLATVSRDHPSFRASASCEMSASRRIACHTVLTDDSNTRAEGCSFVVLRFSKAGVLLLSSCYAPFTLFYPLLWANRLIFTGSTPH